jgi:competence protein ComEA
MLFQQDFSVYQTLYRKNFLIILGKQVHMSWKEFAKDYLIFSRKDRIAGIFVALLIVVIYLLPRLFPARALASIREDTALEAVLDTVFARSAPGSYEQGASYAPVSYSTRKIPKASLFDFNPNTLPAEGWVKLGLKEKTARTIMNYLGKGGHFYKPEDVGKIWGLPPGFYESVKEHIVIEADKLQTNKNNHVYVPYPAYEKKQNPVSININSDDSTAFIALPGIGNKLAGRITSFRQKLGGFYSVEQIGETYGLPDSTFQKIKPLLKIDGTIKKININSATKDELKDHPYIRWKLANAIVEYRNQHGNFTAVDDLKKIVLVDEKTFEKLRHYVEL